MSIPSRVNKENFRLLDLSSDQESEDLQLEIIPSRKKKITRRERNRGVSSQPLEPNISTEVQCALRWALRGTLVLWLVMLTWICAGLYDQVSTLQLEIPNVSTSSNSVNDALQFCHTAAKELRGNASRLHAQLSELEANHQALVKKVAAATQELAAVSEQLSAAPKLADTPRRLAELQRTVADMGSLLNGFDSSLNSAKSQALTAVSGVEEIKKLLHNLELRTNDTIANVTLNVKQGEELKSSIASVNYTLYNNVETLRMRIEEIAKPTSTAAPVTTASTSVATQTTPTTTTTTTTTTQGLPAKPIILKHPSKDLE